MTYHWYAKIFCFNPNINGWKIFIFYFIDPIIYFFAYLTFCIYLIGNETYFSFSILNMNGGGNFFINYFLSVHNPMKQVITLDSHNNIRKNKIRLILLM